MPNQSPIDIEWVTSEIIHDKFNTSQYYERLLRKELIARVVGYNNHLNKQQRKKAEEPKCTRSQMVLYSTLEGEPVALVHQYRRKDGTLGGSGKPDPKKLISPDKIIAVKQTS